MHGLHDLFHTTLASEVCNLQLRARIKNTASLSRGKVGGMKRMKYKPFQLQIVIVKLVCIGGPFGIPVDPLHQCIPPSPSLLNVGTP